MAGICDPISDLQMKVARMIECVKLDPNPEIALGKFFTAQDEFFWPKELQERLFELIETTDLAYFAENVHAAVKRYYPRLRFAESGIKKCDWPEYELLVKAGRRLYLSDDEISCIHPVEIGGERYLLIGEVHYQKRFNNLFLVWFELCKQGKAIGFVEGLARDIECEREWLQCIPGGDERVKCYGLEEVGVYAVVDSLDFFWSISQIIEIEAGRIPLMPEREGVALDRSSIIRTFLERISTKTNCSDVFLGLGDAKKVPKTCSILYETILAEGDIFGDKLTKMLAFPLQNFKDLFQALCLFNYFKNATLFSAKEQALIKKMLSKPSADQYPDFVRLLLREKRNTIFAKHLLSPPTKLPSGKIIRIAQMGYRHPEGVIQEMHSLVSLSSVEQKKKA